MKIVYVEMAAEFVHPAHIEIINQASKMGKVIVGLLTDEVIAKYKKTIHMNFHQRKIVVENIWGVTQVIEQPSLGCEENFIDLKPDYVIYAEDWPQEIKNQSQQSNIVNVLAKWSGQLLESDCLENIPCFESIQKTGTTPNTRMNQLRRLIETKNLIRFMEAHNGLSGLIIEKLSVEKNGATQAFDGIWMSSLTDSTARGKPDTEAVDLTARLQILHDIMDVTSKPIIYDGDTGGRTEHFGNTVRTLERLGVSAIIIEDKIGPKRNSFFDQSVSQSQDSIENFSEKIAFGKLAQVTEGFLIFARIESFIVNAGLDDAMLRAKAYIKAGADGIMIHSRAKEFDEILSFCHQFNQLKTNIPIIVVPASYDKTYESQLIDAGVKIVIYSNHLLRSAYPAMLQTARSILENGRSHEASEQMMSIKEIIHLVPTIT